MVATTWAWLTGYAGIVWPFRAEDNGVSLAWKLALANALPLQLLVSRAYGNIQKSPCDGCSLLTKHADFSSN